MHYIPVPRISALHWCSYLHHAVEIALNYGNGSTVKEQYKKTAT